MARGAGSVMPGLQPATAASGGVRASSIGLVGLVTAALAAVVLPISASAAVALPTSRRVASVPGHNGSVAAAPVDATAGMNVTAVPQVVFPGAGVAEVDVPASAAGSAGTLVRAGALPVSVGAPPGLASPGRVRVEVLPRGSGSASTALTVKVTAVGSPGPVAVRVDYAGFAAAFGAGWTARLRLVSSPACAATTPSDPKCAGRPVATVNDRQAGTLTGRVDATAEGTLVVVESGPSSDGGSYAATALKASATWSAGGSSGDFTWSYPMRTPPVQVGPAPTVGLSYSSQSLDGRTSAANNQASWVGEGFDYHPGAISRAYKACNDDGIPGVGDLCWGSDNATLSMDGRGGELIQVSTNPDRWRLRKDDGTVVERKTGAVNGDDNGEYWKVTTPDGVQYFFGLNRVPGWAGGAVTNSAWTVPVFGNGATEPCHAVTFCSQAYTWNLDYVVDPHGNSMSLWYKTESNNYARNRTDTAVSSYVRGGWLSRIDYGTRQVAGVDSVVTSNAPQRVVFGETDRCITQGPTCTSATPSNWPDVPWDQQCSSTTSCRGIYTPTFFTQKKLSVVRTQLASGSGYRDVETWTLNHVFKNPGDGQGRVLDTVLWLDSLGHAGNVGVSQPETVPNIRFNAVQMANRVDTVTTKNPIVRLRISSIVDEFGGVTTVTYSAPDCTIGSVMPKDLNTKRCYPVYWTPYGTSTPTFDWFHKYVVTQVRVDDRTGGGPPLVSSYEYVGGAAWHYDEAEFVPVEHKSWGQWRGYGKVRVLQGAAGDVQSQTDTVYFRGMNGDKLSSGATRPPVTIPGDPVFGGTAINDEPWRQGQVRETITYNGVGDSAPVVGKTLIQPWEYGPTATRNRGGVVVNAYVTNVKGSTTKVALDGGRGWRTSQTTNTFDFDAGVANPTGRVVMSDDSGDTSTTADDRCTRTTYAANTDRWMLTSPVQVETVAVNCGTTPDRSKDVLADVRTYYDNAATFGTTISKGDATRTERLADWNGGNPLYQQVNRTAYDSAGRPTEVWDGMDRKNTTTYTTDSAGLVTSVKTTNPLGWDTTATVEPAWGLPTMEVDVNGRRTELTYDGLGRLKNVWLPGRDRASNPRASMAFGYVSYSNTGPAAVSQSTLNVDGSGYLTSWTLYDGLLRPRQTQKPAAGGGRVISDTLYDSRGNSVQVNHDYFHAASPGATLFQPDYAVPGRTVNRYDSAGRPATSTFQVTDPNDVTHTPVDRWRVITTHGGDHVDVTAPVGGTGKSTWTDARGNTTALRQYRGNVPSGASDLTSYAYTPDGKLAKLTDPAGNVWTYRYDQQRRLKSQTDPDRGETTFSYNNADQVVTTTDVRGILTRTYDALGRQTGLYDGLQALPAKQLAGWSYDPTLPDGTVLKGRSAGSVRYVGGSGGSAYQTKITNYDAAYRVTTVQVVIPAVEGALAGTYTSTNTYNANGSVDTSTIPAAGGLPAETLTHAYNDVGLPTKLSGLSTYVTDTVYDSFGRVGTLQLSDGGKTLTQIWNYENGTGRLQQHAAYEMATFTLHRNANYTQDPAGNLTSVKDQTADYGAGPDDNQCFRYDHLRRLTEAWTPVTGDCATNPSPSALGGPAAYWHSWTYDAIGNRKTQTDHTPAGDTVHTYTYPAAQSAQPHALSKVDTTVPSGAKTTDSYTYFPSGDTKTRTVAGRPAQNLTWDLEGHLATSTDTSGTTTYVYDADGRRLLTREPGATTLYVNGQEIRRTGTGTLTATRFYGINAVRTPTGVTWAVNDHHGTNHLSVDARTLTKTQRRTTPFGDTRGTTPTWPTTKSFIGGTQDATGLIHIGAREYDRDTGRFISVDPLLDPTDPQQLNAYTYSNNNPTTRSDPTGLKSVDDEEERFEKGRALSPGSGKQAAERRNEEGRKIVKVHVFKHGTVVAVMANGNVIIDGYEIKGIKDPYELGRRIDAGRDPDTSPEARHKGAPWGVMGHCDLDICTADAIYQANTDRYAPRNPTVWGICGVVAAGGPGVQGGKSLCLTHDSKYGLGITFTEYSKVGLGVRIKELFTEETLEALKTGRLMAVLLKAIGIFGGVGVMYGSGTAVDNSGPGQTNNTIIAADLGAGYQQTTPNHVNANTTIVFAGAGEMWSLPGAIPSDTCTINLFANTCW